MSTSYKPPASRMRQIKAHAPARASRHPQNVEEAIQRAAAAQDAGEEVAEEIRVPVGAVDAVIKPGPDKRFGTPDDEVRIEGHKDDGAHEHDADADADADHEVEKPKYEKGMKKAELVAIAEAHGVEVEDDMTKAKLVAALDAHFGE